MARYKQIDTSPRFLAVDLERQLLPGSFEHALNYLVDHELEFSRFDARYKNDFTGASAYPPAMLLKIVLFAYSRGIVSHPPRTMSQGSSSCEARLGGESETEAVCLVLQCGPRRDRQSSQ